MSISTRNCKEDLVADAAGPCDAVQMRQEALKSKKLAEEMTSGDAQMQELKEVRAENQRLARSQVSDLGCRDEPHALKRYCGRHLWVSAQVCFGSDRSAIIEPNFEPLKLVNLANVQRLRGAHLSGQGLPIGRPAYHCRDCPQKRLGS